MKVENRVSKVQIIRDERNEPVYAILPWSEYKSLKQGRSETSALIDRGRAALDDEKFPSAVARRLASGESPLKVFREWRELTQNELGRLAGIAPQYLSQLERGNRNMGQDTARKLAPLLSVSIQVLLDEEPARVQRFAVGQKYRARGNSSRTAEVMELDEESQGWKALVDVRDGKQLLQSDWVNHAVFTRHWALIE